jgi:hypothetical protein
MTKRQEALKWWDSLTIDYKQGILDATTKIIGVPNRDINSLTGREIEILFDDKCRSDSEIIEMAFGNENKNKGTQRSPFGIGS